MTVKLSHADRNNRHKICLLEFHWSSHGTMV